jgi:hypothetical protein
MLEYNKENLKKVSDIIMKHLTPDLLPKKGWIEKNKTNPTFGHCHTVSGCIWKIFGSKSVRMYRAIDDEGIGHVWIQDKDGVVVDLTSAQYTDFGRTPPYKDGIKTGIFGFNYRKKVNELYEIVMKELNHD